MKLMNRVVVLAVAGFMFASTANAARSMVVEKGKRVKFEYTLTVDGKVFDTNKGKAPIEYICGSNQIVPGLDKALEGLKAGQKKKIVIAPEDGYGPIRPQAFAKLPKSAFPENFQFRTGSVIDFNLPDGTKRAGVIMKVQDGLVIVDLNHPLAGKTLKFDVKIVDVQPGFQAVPAK